MSESRLLLCTDMDRTIIPNGVQSEYQYARKHFAELCALPQVMLVYVTGRHQKLVIEAIKNYSLPKPDYVITDVGTKIYQINKHWQEMSAWKNKIDSDWNGKNRQQIEMLLTDIPGLRLQETGKQNTHKLSYYVSLFDKKGKILPLISERLNENDVNASLIWSVDEPKSIGLLDVLPRNGTKLHAIDFLRRYLDYSLNEVIFAGDSGNDLPVMESSIPSVMVANAAKDVKLSAIKQAELQGNQKSLYIATGKDANNNGNYSAGVLEGICYFAPVFCKQMQHDGVCYE